jgi:hypothetical protein
LPGAPQTGEFWWGSEVLAGREPRAPKTDGYCWRTHFNPKADVSTRDVPGSSRFKEAVDGVKFTALWSSPTVSGRLWRTLQTAVWCIRIRSAYPAIYVTGILARFARPHRITSLAWKRRVGGMVRPMASAVLRLMTSSNVVGCSTGRSPGLVPFKMRSTWEAARWNNAAKFGP